MKINLLLRGALVSLSLLLSCMTLAQNAPAPTATELQVRADDLGKQTFKRTTGEVLTFKQIRELPSGVKEAILDDEMDSSKSNAFLAYSRLLTDVAKARNDELDKNLAALNARNDELDKNLAALNARNDELDKNLAALNARADELDNQLIGSALLLIKHGKSLNKNDKGFYEELATKKPNDRRIKEILSRAKFE